MCVLSLSLSLCVEKVIHTVWDGLLQMTLYSLLLGRLLGPAALVAVGLLALLLPLNRYY